MNTSDQMNVHPRALAWMLAVPVSCLLLAPTLEAGNPGSVLASQKISQTSGGFGGLLDNTDIFGRDVAAVGDLDGNGVTDLAIGVEQDDDGGNARGAVWITFMNADGTVMQEQKISSTQGDFNGPLNDGDFFGAALAPLGDLDGDGVPDLAVGARDDDDGVMNAGAVWILFLRDNGTVKSEQKISATAGGFTGTLGHSDRFACSVANIGDLNDDGVVDLAVGALGDDDGGSSISGRGAVWILNLGTDGTVSGVAKISDTVGGLTAPLDDLDQFGRSVTGLGDIDGDGVEDLAVGTSFDDDGGNGAGAVYVLRLNANGSVAAEQKISATAGGFTGTLEAFDQFGYSVSAFGDLDGNGVTELAVGTPGDDDGGSGRGAIYVLFLEADGQVALHQKISDTTGGIVKTLDNDDQFGTSVGALGDFDGNGAPDLLVGAALDDDGGFNVGAVWLLRLIPAVACPADLDGSGDVGFGDILAAIGAWGPCAGCPEDIDGSGDVGFSDVLAIIGAWGPCP